MTEDEYNKWLRMENLKAYLKWGLVLITYMLLLREIFVRLGIFYVRGKGFI